MTLTHNASIYSFYCLPKKKKNNFLFFVICIILSIIILITLFMAFSQNKYNYYNSCSYYLLSLYLNQNNQTAINAQDAIASAGGAGYIYKSGSTIHVIAFAYLSKADAENVKKANVEAFDSASVVELNAEKIKNGVKRCIISNNSLQQGFEYICLLVKKIYNLAIDYDAEKIELSQLFSRLEEIKIELNEVLTKIESVCVEDKVTENIKNALRVSLNVYLKNLMTCRDEVYKNHAIEKNLKLLCVEWCFEEVNLRKTLNSF